MTDGKHPPEDEKDLQADANADADDTAAAGKAGDAAGEQETERKADAETEVDAAAVASAETQNPAVSETQTQPPDGDEPQPMPEQTAPASSTTPAAKPRGRGLAVFALLIALAGAAGVGYLYYLLVYLQPLQQVRDQGAAMREQYERMAQDLRDELAAVESDTADALAAAATAQAERLASTEAAVTKSLNQALQAAPPSQREWKLAEAEYLLRIANHRVLMEQDSVGALALLQAADQIMAELDDFSLHQVRARLADEIMALRQVPRDDLQGVYLQIESVKSQIDNLPLPQPDFLQAQSEPEQEQSVWMTLYGELKKFVRVRSLDNGEALQPLLAPEEARYLELNLRLALEQAQLATLKRRQAVFEQSLLNVRRWLVAHADTDDARTRALLESIDELLVLELARPMPEISGSLNELLSIRRSSP